MPLKVTVGLSKKIGLANFGSLGASCHVEFELPASLPSDDRDSFGRQVRDAYFSCAKAVNEELTRQSAENGTSPIPPPPTTQATTANGSAKSNGNGNGNGIHPASDKQLSYARQLAGKIQGLGISRLDSVARSLFTRPMMELSSHEASQLIDRLKAVQQNRMTLDTVLNGGPDEH